MSNHPVEDPVEDWDDSEVGLEGGGRSIPATSTVFERILPDPGIWRSPCDPRGHGRPREFRPGRLSRFVYDRLVRPSRPLGPHADGEPAWFGEGVLCLLAGRRLVSCVDGQSGFHEHIEGLFLL